MSFSFDARFAPPDHVLVREVEGELVLLNLETEQYFGMDKTSSRFWRVLSENPTIDGAYGSLLEEFEVDPQTLRTDLVSFIDDLSKRGLVEVELG